MFGIQVIKVSGVNSQLMKGHYGIPMKTFKGGATMRKALALLTALGTLGAVALAGSVYIGNEPEHRHMDKAQIGLDRAREIALQQVQGKVLKAGLENENGYLVYGVEILKPDGTVANVKVDAGTGKVLRVDLGEDEHGEEHEGVED